MAKAAVAALDGQIPIIDRMAEEIAQRLAAGGTLYTAGNGGSAAEALHLAEELVGRYRSNRPPLRAICLAADPTGLTCIANDFGFENVFARPCEAFLTPADVLVLFSTSGRSPNITRAAAVAKGKGSLVIGLLGGDGGETVRQCDVAVVVAAAAGVPPFDSAAVQEAHQVVLHILCERLETEQRAPSDV
ncbi:MAG: SIS domain-containing protein [Phycisphaerae bacterium]|nr:SIS domain-containing protein [Phycisphaerae bacterium]